MAAVFIHIKKLLRILPLLVLLGACAKQKKVFQSDCNSSKDYKKISFTELASHIEKYDKQYVEVSGKYKEGNEQSALFNDSLFSSHALHNAIWVDFSQDCPLYLPGTHIGLFTYNDGQFIGMNKRKVTIRGVVDASDKGHLKQYRGTIDRVSFIEL
ncbi:hypothetical protein [Mucilaginibacter sp. NFR10]|uniref:hypothetical protein n=1 Tax=Mucilaginibacter sp. NFR10 TaxID=1566292 RepID=UPI0008711B66|nr:hypothetical protein [Mucilaginibacter sp. NFR10]SCW61059.1 hypothetical protein SAMN03159284_02264 [Mucilaginibacter sp. NFR10]